MKRADGNSRLLRSGGEKQKEAHAADRRIEEILRRDRASLAGRHDPDRARGRAMGLLAAGTAPAAETAGTGSGFLSRLAGIKGTVGAVALLVAGVSLGVIFTVSKPADPAPAIVPAREMRPPQSPEKGVEWKESGEPGALPISSGAASADGPREVPRKKGEAAEKTKEGKKEERVAETPVGDAPPPEEPGVEERNAARTELQITPVITNGK